MNFHHRRLIADNHEIEHTFEELSPVIGGVKLDILLSGTAMLQNDGNDDFVVTSISFDGTVRDTFAKTAFGRVPTKPAHITIKRPAATDHSEQAALFRMTERAIYASAAAQEAWVMEGVE